MVRDSPGLWAASTWGGLGFQAGLSAWLMTTSPPPDALVIVSVDTHFSRQV